MSKTTTTSIDTAIAALTRDNYAKIAASAPRNPALSQTDEWRDEEYWDEFFEELQRD